MFQNNQDLLFYSDVDISLKPFSLSKKQVVSIRDIDGVKAEIKTVLGDTFITKNFTAAHIINQFGKVEIRDEVS